MKEFMWLACFIIFGQGIVILYLLNIVKDSTREHGKSIKDIAEDVLLALKANNSFEFAQSRAFQKDQDQIRKQTAQTPSIPFDPSQASPTPNTITTKDGKELQILRPII